MIKNCLANIYLAEGDINKAVKYYIHASKGLEKHCIGVNDPVVATSTLGVAESYLRNNSISLASEWCEKAERSLYPFMKSRNHPKLSYLYFMRGEICLFNHSYLDAAQNLLDALSCNVKYFEQHNIRTAMYLGVLASILLFSDFDKSMLIKIFNHVILVFNAQLAYKHYRIIDFQFYLGFLYCEIDQKTIGLSFIRNSLYLYNNIDCLTIYMRFLINLRYNKIIKYLSEDEKL